jgi:putative oxidoreductase
MSSLITLYQQFIQKLAPLHDGVLFLARLWLAKVFFMAGLTKIDSWESTLLLFEHEYAVPFLPVAFAAFSATFFELVVPPLLVLGLFTRFAAIPLLVMTAVIEFTYNSYLEHTYWALLFGILITYGAGRLSLDHLVAQKLAAKG